MIFVRYDKLSSDIASEKRNTFYSLLWEYYHNIDAHG